VFLLIAKILNFLKKPFGGFLGVVFLATFSLLLWNIYPIASNLEILFSEQWNPEAGQFGVFSMLIGTIACALVANLLVFPIGVATAFCIRFTVIESLQRKLLLPLELLAAVPSLVFGMIGLAYVGPELFQMYQNSFVSGFMQEKFGIALVTDANFITGSLVLALLLLPYSVVYCFEVAKGIVAEELMAADSLGVRRLFFVVKVALPQLRWGLVASFMQCLSRALGEAVALSLVIGRADTIFRLNEFSSSQKFVSIFLNPGQTLATKLAGPELFLSWSDSTYRAAILSLVLCLFAVTALFFLGAELFVSKNGGARNEVL
jgi:phosphate transport system permease protein